MKNITKKRAFTLVELLVVIAIIGILATIVMINVLGATAKARDSQRAASLRQVQTAVEMFKEINNKYPGIAKKWYVSQGNQGFTEEKQTSPEWASTGGDLTLISDLKPYLDPLPREPRCGLFLSNCNNQREIGYRYWHEVSPDTKRDEYELDSGMEVRTDLVANDGGVRQGTISGNGMLWGRYELGTRLYLMDCGSHECDWRTSFPLGTFNESDALCEEFKNYCNLPDLYH